MAGFRDVFIYDYFGKDNGIVWNVICQFNIVMILIFNKEVMKRMTCHYFISTIRPIPEYHSEENNYPFMSGESYKNSLPLTLPYVYELGGENVEFISFLDDFMELGDVIEQYIYEEGRHGRPLSFNYPEEARTINLVKKTYKDQFGVYHLDKKNWKEELARRTIASKRSVTTFVKI